MMSPGRKSGFTVIELCIAVALLGILFVKLTLVLNQASKVSQRETVSIALEDQAAVLLDRIAYAVIGSDPETLFPNNESPFFSDNIKYQVSLGVEDGRVIWSDQEVIGLAAEPSKLYWAKNEGLPTEQVVIWCRTVAEYFEQEVANGDDDNENGLTDESGLCFELDRQSVTIRLTLERAGPEGPVRFTKSTKVTCRN